MRVVRLRAAGRPDTRPYGTEYGLEWNFGIVSRLGRGYYYLGP